MKTTFELVKSMLTGGLFVLLPLLLLYLMISEAVELVIALATPIADLFPDGTFDFIRSPALLAVLLIVVLSLVIGLAMRSAFARRAGRGFERVVLDRVPLYRALSSLMGGFTSSGDGRAFKAAVLTGPDRTRQLVYIVEDPGGEHVTVLRPHSPTGFAGPVLIVRRDEVEVLEATIGDVSQVLAHWGVGAQALLKSRGSDDA